MDTPVLSAASSCSVLCCAVTCSNGLWCCLCCCVLFPACAHAAVQRLMGVVLTLLESPAQREGRQHAAAPGQQSQFVACVVQLLLTAPGLESSLPTATKVRQACANTSPWQSAHVTPGRVPAAALVALNRLSPMLVRNYVGCLWFSTGLQVRLLEPSIMCGQLLPAVGQLCSSGALAAQPAAHCLANLAQLLTGCAPGSNQQQQQQAHSRSLGDGQVAAAYVDAAVQLLLAARRPASAPSGRQRAPRTPQVSIPVSDVLLDECWMLGTQQHLLPLLQTLQQHSQHGMVLWAGYCCHLLQDAPKKAGSGSQGLSSNVLNVLAFAPRVLPSLWDWLARTAGLPLEAPLQASRGLDIAGGCSGRAACNIKTRPQLCAPVCLTTDLLWFIMQRVRAYQGKPLLGPVAACTFPELYMSWCLQPSRGGQKTWHRRSHLSWACSAGALDHTCLPLTAGTHCSHSRPHVAVDAAAHTRFPADIVAAFNSLVVPQNTARTARHAMTATTCPPPCTT